MTKIIKKITAHFTSKTGENLEIKGLPLLHRNLERDFFSNVTISNSKVCCEHNNLVISMDCPMELHQVIYHVQQGLWGGNKMTSLVKGLSMLYKQMEHIREINQFYIDVEELSINLNDCSIIIKKIAPESVENQLELILSVLAENYVNITREFSETPTEIYIPVFEEVSSMGHFSILAGTKRITEKGYFTHWGLYFDSEAVIYDLKSKTIITGDLNIFNQ